jgi:hypothetical protein
MVKSDVQGFIILLIVAIGCIYHRELAELIGSILTSLFACLG